MAWLSARQYTLSVKLVIVHVLYVYVLYSESREVAMHARAQEVEESC